MGALEDSQINRVFWKRKEGTFSTVFHTRLQARWTSFVVGIERSRSFASLTLRCLLLTSLNNCVAELVQGEYQGYLPYLLFLSFSSSFYPSEILSSKSLSSSVLKQREKGFVVS